MRKGNKSVIIIISLLLMWGLGGFLLADNDYDDAEALDPAEMEAELEEQGLDPEELDEEMTPDDLEEDVDIMDLEEMDPPEEEVEDPRITEIQFQDAPVSLVLNYIAQESGMSVNASDDVRGRVSISMRDAPVSRAVEHLANSYGWKKIQPDAQSYTLVTEEEYRDWQHGQRQDYTFEVSHVEADEAARLLEGRLSDVGELASDDRTGKIFVTDLPENIEQMSQVLEQVDVDVVTRSFKLEHSLPREVEQQIRDYLSQRGKLSIDERTRQITVSDRHENIRKIENLIKEIDYDTELRIYQIRYLAETDDRRELEELRQAIEPLLTPEAYFEVDERSNIVLVRDIPSVLDRVGEVIDAYDQPPKQVYIVGRLFQVVAEDEFEIGTEFQRLWGDSDDRLDPMSDIDSFVEGDGTFDERLSHFHLSGEISQLVFMDLDRFELAIRMMSRLRGSELLIAPQLLVRHQQPARIMSGGEEPYRVLDRRRDRDDYTTATQRTVDWGVKMEVTPHIHHDGLIDLDIYMESSDYEIRDDEHGRLVGRITDDLETKITIPSGKAVMLGGMIRSEEERSERGIPYLHRIPVIGSVLFGRRATDATKRELFLFLAPRIVDFEDDFYDEFIEMQSFDEIQEGRGATEEEDLHDFRDAEIDEDFDEAVE